MSGLRCDVLIAGAGPAGSSLACRLASAGLNVLLCEKSRFPREKLCGEFLSPDGIACLERLGAGDDLRAARPAGIRSWLVTAPSRASLERDLPAPALGLSRAVLDHLLLLRAVRSGATVLQGCRVTSVERSNPDSGSRSVSTVRAEIDGEALGIEARCVVDAAGRLGGLRTADARRHDARPADEVGVQEHRALADSSVPGTIELHVFRGGYAGMNRIEGGRVTTCLIASAARLQEAGSPEALLDLAAAENPCFAERRAQLGAREGELRTTARHRAPRMRSRIVLEIGDAAGMIAPACGDGISIALRSAELAAPLLIAHAGGHPWDGVLRLWDHVRARELASRIRWGRALEATLMRPWAAETALAIGRVVPVLGDVLARKTRGGVTA